MKWLIITGILCMYGFLKEFRPVEPFLTPYLQSPLKNFTELQLTGQIYPFWTYSYLLVLIPTFVLTDLLRYKPVIFLEGLTYAVTWVLLIWTDTVGCMQWMQIFYGCATATEVAYFAYIFAAVDGKHYKKAASFVKGATQLGRFFSAGLSQLIVYIYGHDYQLLNYISLASCIMILPLAASLPWITYKRHLVKAADIDQTSSNDLISSSSDQIDHSIPTSYLHFLNQYFENLWSNFKCIYSSSFMWKWSLWWALATCGYLQVGNYVQNLWSEVQSDGQDVLNGVVEAANTLLSCIVVMCIQFIHVRWELWGELILAITCAIDCALLIIIGQTKVIGIAYAFYIIFVQIYQLMFTIGMYNIAKRLKSESYGLVFGFNTFIALALQTILTFVVTDKSGLALNVRPQFFVYGAYYGCIALLFAIMGSYTVIINRRRNRIGIIQSTNQNDTIVL